MDSVLTYKGYQIFQDSDGSYFLNGLNGLGQPKKISFTNPFEMAQWIDSELKNRYGLGR
jgi:hypothetical protein